MSRRLGGRDVGVWIRGATGVVLVGLGVGLLQAWLWAGEGERTANGPSNSPAVSGPASAETAGSQAGGLRPGQVVVAKKLRTVRIEHPWAVKVNAGTELKVQQMPGQWLWVAVARKKTVWLALSERGSQQKEEFVHGWVLAEEVLPGLGGTYRWLRLLPGSCMSRWRGCPPGLEA